MIRLRVFDPRARKMSTLSLIESSLRWFCMTPTRFKLNIPVVFFGNVEFICGGAASM